MAADPIIVSAGHGPTVVRFPGTTYIPGKIDAARFLTGRRGVADALVVDGDVVVTLR